MSIEIQRQDDYDINLQYVLEQFKDSTKMMTMLKAFNAEMDKVEDAFFEIRDNFYLEDAEGVQLDAIGLVFSELRAGRSDTEYRSVLRIITAQSFSGTPEDMYEQMRALHGATSSQYIRNTAEAASFIMNTDADITQAELEQMSPAGVSSTAGGVLLLENGDNLVFEDGSLILAAVIL